MEGEISMTITEDELKDIEGRLGTNIEGYSTDDNDVRKLLKHIETLAAENAAFRGELSVDANLAMTLLVVLMKVSSLPGTMKKRI